MARAVKRNKKLCYRRRTTRRDMLLNIVNCRNKLYTRNPQQIEAIDRLLINSNDGKKNHGVQYLTQQRLSYRCRQQARLSTTTTTSLFENAIDLLWRNFLSPEFGTKLQREVAYRNFLRYPIFLARQCGIGGRKPPCRKSTRFVQSFRYRRLLQTDGRTDTKDNSIYRGSIASRSKK